MEVLAASVRHRIEFPCFAYSIKYPVRFVKQKLGSREYEGLLQGEELPSRGHSGRVITFLHTRLDDARWVYENSARALDEDWVEEASCLLSHQ